MNIHKLTAATAAALALLATTPAHATGMIAGATFPEQIVQELTLVEQYATQAQSLQADFQQVYNQAVNMQSIGVNSWSSIGPQLNNLVSLVGNAQGVTYATQNTLDAVAKQYGDPSGVLKSTSQTLGKWTSDLNSQVAAALKQFGLNANNFQTVQGALKTIQSKSQSADGRKAVMQAGNQISGLMVNQLQSLQADMNTANNVIITALTNKANGQVQSDNAMNNWMSAPPQPGPF